MVLLFFGVLFGIISLVVFAKSRKVERKSNKNHGSNPGDTG